MNDFNNIDYLNQALNNGAFITSGDNTMIASWGMLGVMWGKKVFVAPIRESRYTKKFIDETGEFSVSIPFNGTMKKEIAFCGTKSGRDYDKWKECSLEKIKTKKINTYVVGGCEKYFECKVISKVLMGDIPEDLKKQWYKVDDKHTFYFAEIVEEY